MPEVISPIEKGYVGTESIVAPGDIIIEGETLVEAVARIGSGEGGSGGANGRTPSFALEVGAERVVARIVSWSAGAGATPPTGYLSETGITQDISQAVNLKGATGADGQQGQQGQQGQTGGPGLNGWTPILTVEADGNRRVLRVMDWVGGEGTKPNTGYLGAAGITQVLANAINLAVVSTGGEGGVTTEQVQTIADESAERVAIPDSQRIKLEELSTHITVQGTSTEQAEEVQAAVYIGTAFPGASVVPADLRQMPYTIPADDTYYLYLIIPQNDTLERVITVNRGANEIRRYRTGSDFSEGANGALHIGGGSDSFTQLRLRQNDVVSITELNASTIIRGDDGIAIDGLLSEVILIYRRTAGEAVIGNPDGTGRGVVSDGKISQLPSGWSTTKPQPTGDSADILYIAIGVVFSKTNELFWSSPGVTDESISEAQAQAIVANTAKLAVSDDNVAPLTLGFDREIPIISQSIGSGVARELVGTLPLDTDENRAIIPVLQEGASYTVDITFSQSPITGVETDAGNIMTAYLTGSASFNAAIVAGSAPIDTTALSAGGYSITIEGQLEFDFTNGVHIWIEKSTGAGFELGIESIAITVLPDTYNNILTAINNEITERGLITSDQTTDLLHRAHIDAVDYVDSEVEDWAKTSSGNTRIPQDKLPLEQTGNQFLNSLVQHDVHDGSFDTDIVSRGAIFDVPYVTDGRAGQSSWALNPSFQTTGYSVIGSLAQTIEDSQKSSPAPSGAITNRANLDTPATLYGRRIVDDTTGATSARYFGFAFKVTDGEFWNGANPLTNPFGGTPFALLKVDNQEILRSDASGTYLEAYTEITDATEAHQVYLSPILSAGQIATSDGNGIVIDNAGMSGVFDYNASDKAVPNVITVHVGIPFVGIDVERITIGETGDTLSEDRTFTFAGHNIRMRLTFDRTSDRFSYSVIGGSGGQGTVITATAESAEHTQGSDPDFRRLTDVPLGPAPGSHSLVGFVSTNASGVLEVRFSFDGGATQQVVTGFTPVRTGDLEFGTQAGTSTLNAWYYSEMIWERASALSGNALLTEIRNLSREWASRPPIYNPFADERDLVLPAGRLKIDTGTELIDVDPTKGPTINAIDHYVHLGTSDLNGSESGVLGSSSYLPSSIESIHTDFIRFDNTLPGVNIPNGATYNSAFGELYLQQGHWIICVSLNIVTNRATNARVIAYVAILQDEYERHAQSLYLRNDQFGTTQSNYEMIQGKVSVTGAVNITSPDTYINCKLSVVRQSTATTRIDINGAHLHAYQQLI